VHLEPTRMILKKCLARLVHLGTGLFSANGSATSALKATNALLKLDLLLSVLTVNSRLLELLLA
jgi:hypothetical protein